MIKYSYFPDIATRLGFPDINSSTIPKIHLSLIQEDIENIINGKLRQKLGRVDKDGRLIILPLSDVGTKIRITNTKSEFKSIEIESNVSNFGILTVIKKSNSNVVQTPRQFTPHNPSPASFRSVSVKDNVFANQRLDSLIGFEVGDVICIIAGEGQTVNVKHNTVLDDRFKTISAADVLLLENTPIYFEKRMDSDGGSWYELESIIQSGFNTVTIPNDVRLVKKGSDGVIGVFRYDTAENKERHDNSMNEIDLYLDERFGITINQRLDPVKISEGSN
jgi:hypothetical protein